VSEHADVMRLSDQRQAELGALLLESIAQGRDTTPIDEALDAARRDYRRAERKLRREQRRTRASALSDGGEA
jgi:hypothetical protein